MPSHGKNGDNMKDHELDRIMSDDDVIPSAGFAMSVMRAVRRETAAPPAIEFPWARALPVFACVAISFVFCFVLLVRQALGSGHAPPTLAPSISDIAGTYGIGWIALALALTFLSVKLPFLILRARRRARHFLAV